MTFKDKLKEEYPDMYKRLSDGFPIGCPVTYGYEEHPQKECTGHSHIHEISCQDCWNREIPEDDENELDDVSIWPEVAILLSFLGVIFVIAASQMF